MLSTLIRGLHGVYIIWYRDVLRFWRDRARMLTTLAMPVLYLVIFGTGIASIFKQGEFDYLAFMYPGIIAMVVIFGSIMTGVTVVFDREFGFLKEVLVAPLSRSGVALGKTLGGATVAMLQGILLLVLAPLIGADLTPLLVLKLIPLMLLLAVTVSAFGILMASKIQSMQAFPMVMQVVVFPLIFLSGVFFPVSNVPVWLEVMVKINPVTYGVDAIRKLFIETDGGLSVSLFGHTMGTPEDVAIVLAFGAAAVIAAMWSFERLE